MKETLIGMWHSMYFQDVLVALLIGLFAWIGIAMSKRSCDW